MKDINLLLLVIPTISLFNSCANITKNKEENTGKKEQPIIVNIINFIHLSEPRIDKITEEILYETVVKQVEIMRKHKVGGTFLLQNIEKAKPSQKHWSKSPRNYRALRMGYLTITESIQKC
ncbi:MAG: hypothetical protein JKX82_00730 [Oleispira sp.]|nr:hypothetical protein [Oleispira sp.]